MSGWPIIAALCQAESHATFAKCRRRPRGSNSGCPRKPLDMSPKTWTAHRSFRNGCCRPQKDHRLESGIRRSQRWSNAGRFHCIYFGFYCQCRKRNVGLVSDNNKTLGQPKIHIRLIKSFKMRPMYNIRRAVNEFRMKCRTSFRPSFGQPHTHFPHNAAPRIQLQISNTLVRI